MGDISKGEGRTVLFVSHNMAAVQSLCSKGILLENGRVSCNDEIRLVVDKYMVSNRIPNFWKQNNKPSLTSVFFSSISANVIGKQPSLKLEVNLEIFINNKINKKSFLAFYISGNDSTPLMEAIPEYDFIDCSFPDISKKIVAEIDLNGFIPGIYNLGIWIGIEHTVTLDWQKEIIQFEIEESPVFNRTVSFPKHAGFLVPNSKIIDIK
jgi:lipopolysaccharide transport system ATP-binding protein